MRLPRTDLSWLASHRYWILAAVLVATVGLTSLLGARSKRVAGGLGVSVRFGAHIQPPAGSNDLLPFNNGWIASGGSRNGAIAVYASSQPTNRQNGFLVIQSHTGGRTRRWRTRTIALPGSGALTLLRPAVPASESAALQETLHFVTANGATGTLDLSSDKVKLSS